MTKAQQLAIRHQLDNLTLQAHRMTRQSVHHYRALIDLADLVDEVIIESNGGHPPEHASTVGDVLDHAVEAGDLHPDS